MTWFAALAVVVGLLSTLPWVTVAGLVVLATQAVLPRSPVLLFWPIGLVAVVVASYGGFWVYWWRRPSGITDAWPTVTFLVIAVVSLVVIVVRRPRERPSVSWLDRMTFVVTALPAVFVMQFGARQSVNSPLEFLGNFMYGGDHSLHANIAFKFTHWAQNHDFPSPFQVYNYPSGLHFFGANVSELNGRGGYSPAGRVFIEMGRLNWVLLAAFIQLAMTVMVGKPSVNRIFRVLSAIAVLVLMAGVPNFVFQLFWAGFMTSLGISVVLLGLFAVLFWQLTGELVSSRVEKVCLLIMFTYAAAITYQPYAVIPLALLAGELARYALGKLPGSARSTHLGIRLLGRTPFIIGCMGGVVPLIVYFLRGAESPSLKSLLLSGATMNVKPELAFVVGAAGIVGAFQVGRMRSRAVTGSLVTAALASTWVFTASLVWIVGKTGGLSVQTQPYYTQKAMWLLLMVSAPMVAAAVLHMVAPAIARAGRESLLLRLSTPVFIALIPWSLSYQVDSGLLNIRNPRMSWFTPSYVEKAKAGEWSVAFTQEDPLGSHIANLALHLVSQLRVAPEFSLNADPAAACAWISTNPVRRVYTTPVGYETLVANGCPIDDVRYIYSG